MAPKVFETAVGRLLQLDAWAARPAVAGHTGPLDPRDHAWTAPIAAALPDIRRELDALLATGHRLPTTDAIAGYEQGGEGEWTTYVLTWFGSWVAANRARFPATVAAVHAVPGLQVAGFTVLGPGAHLPRHAGPAHALRYQLGVIVPAPEGSCRLQVGDEVITWTSGGELLFDDGTPHEAWNDSAERRYVLFVQARMPVGGLRGVLHRATQWTFGALTRGVPRRAARFDRELSPPAAAP